VLSPLLSSLLSSALLCTPLILPPFSLTPSPLLATTPLHSTLSQELNKMKAYDLGAKAIIFSQFVNMLDVSGLSGAAIATKPSPSEL
jgi:SNF2 family DNA or RNA helicase